MNDSTYPIHVPAAVPPKRPPVIDLRSTSAQPEPMFWNPEAAELEVSLLASLDNPTEAKRNSTMLRNCLLLEAETGDLEWALVARAYLRIIEAAATAPTETTMIIATDAAAVLGGAPEPETAIRQQAGALLDLARDTHHAARNSSDRPACNGR